MKEFIKRETVFCIALLASVITAFFNPPSSEYLSAIDWRTLALLFTLMAVSEGLKTSGMFTFVASALEKKAGNMTRLSFLLVAIVFISSMFFTNDVSLLMFVPFTILIFQREGASEKTLVPLIVLETIAANLGSMATPVGNPQNIYICSYYGPSAGEFFSVILPYSLASALLIALSCFILLRDRSPLKEADEDTPPVDRKKSTISIVILVLALLSVFRILPYQLLFALTLVYLLVFDRKTLASIDYILLLTFVCFFIFSANMKAMDSVSRLLSIPMESAPLLTSAAISQVISNVPAAILLAPFTDNWEAVLVGTDIGGLGTPVASLASLISLKFYFRKESGMKGRYMALFLALNFILLACLFLLSLVI